MIRVPPLPRHGPDNEDEPGAETFPESGRVIGAILVFAVVACVTIWTIVFLWNGHKP